MIVRLSPLLLATLVACGSKTPPPEPTPDASPTTETSAASATATSAPDVTPAATTRFFLLRLTLPQGIPLKGLLKVTAPAAATLDIPLQGLKDGALSEVVVSDTSLTFVFLPPGAPPAAANRFKAELKGDAFEGAVTVGETSIPIRLTAVAGPEALVAQRPQTPKPPLPYPTEELRVETQGGGLGCTLSLPATPGPYGAVIMLTGSGVQDRDETIFDHKPFFVIADALARGGVASVRCDDRGAGQSAGDPAQVDAAVFVADTEAVLAAVRKRPEIDPLRIGLFGHSEGGMTAAAVAKKPENRIAFVVTLAGPAQSGREILVRQNRDVILEQGAKASAADAIERAVDTYFAAIVAAADDKDPAVALAAKALAETVSGAIEGEATPENSVSALTSNFEGLARQKWLKGFLSATPAADLAAANVPLLALFGEKDVQVRAPENSAALQAAFASIKGADLTIHVVSGANHLFQDAKTGALVEYDEIDQTIAPSTLTLIVDWVAKHTGAKP